MSPALVFRVHWIQKIRIKQSFSTRIINEPCSWTTRPVQHRGDKRVFISVRASCWLKTCWTCITRSCALLALTSLSFCFYKVILSKPHATISGPHSQSFTSNLSQYLLNIFMHGVNIKVLIVNLFTNPHVCAAQPISPSSPASSRLFLLCYVLQPGFGWCKHKC